LPPDAPGNLLTPTPSVPERVRSRDRLHSLLPCWSLVVITLDVFVIWAMAAHGGEARDDIA